MSSIKEKQLEELLLKISEVNLTNSLGSQLKDIQIEYEIEDMNSFLSVLNTINKSKIKKILSVQSVDKNKHSSKQKVAHNYTSEEIKTIFSESDAENINNTFSKKELENMYFSLKGIKPLTSYKKQQIINDIYLTFRAENRTKNLHMNYSNQNNVWAIS